jgi:apolipoprotein N-acyltransferase
VFKKISASPWMWSLLSGASCVLAFPPIEVTGLLFLCPFFLLLAADSARRGREAILYGFLTSFAIMAGGFYWVVYVLHTFGDMPWAVAGLLYFLFCGFGALGIPLFSFSLYFLGKKIPSLRQSVLWWVVGAPALFVLFEFFTPKLFPWYVGHAYYKTFWLNQIVELTGSSFLTFLIFTWGGLAFVRLRLKRASLTAVAIPFALTLVTIGFSAWRLRAPMDSAPPKTVALIQANIGSLDKLQARRGYTSKLAYNIQKYLSLSERALRAEPAPSFLLWPETAMPFSLSENSVQAGPIREAVTRWGIPLITGGYATGDGPGDYNAAFLISPEKEGTLRTSIYRKNILLAFGEYFPGGEWFPRLYEWFPQVSHFLHGKDQTVFELEDGTRLGVTVCYEDISPKFFRKVTSQGVHAVVNLTNDSWFGPTSEPYQHAALAVFRAIENRTALARVTNTGISFVVDRVGRMSQTTEVYQEGTLNLALDVAKVPSTTFYLRFGDWFIALLFFLVLGLVARAFYAPLPR